VGGRGTKPYRRKEGEGRKHEIIKVWEYNNIGMGIWDTKELDETGQDTEGMKNEGRKQGRGNGSKEGRPRKEEMKIKEGRNEGRSPEHQQRFTILITGALSAVLKYDDAT